MRHPPDPAAGRRRRTRHEPVLLQLVTEHLALGPGLVCVDATLGGAGHFIEIARRIAPGGLAVGIDRDTLALRRAEAGIAAADIRGVGVRLVHAAFSELVRVADELGLERVDRMLFDFGLSSDQLDDPKRGFSFLRDGPLDMRQDIGVQTLTAEEVVNEYGPTDLLQILREYGEERHAQRIVQAIVDERRRQPIVSTRQLADLIARVVPGRGRIHPATRTFQALRIEVGEETDEIMEGLPAAAELLSMDGRLAIITFHGLEERLVKQALRPFGRHAKRTDWILVRVNGVFKPDREEIVRNPRSRSAKLRVYRKVAVEQ